MPRFKVRYIAVRRKQVPRLLIDDVLARKEDVEYVDADDPQGAVSQVRDKVVQQLEDATQAHDGDEGVHPVDFNLVSVLA